MHEESYDGGCACGEVRYRMSCRPMYVHCCHCSWCRRESGAAYALNGMVEGDAVKILRGQAEIIDVPTLSGRGKKATLCPSCRVVLWGNFTTAGQRIHFVRIGTLDAPELFPPDVHIFTSTKLPWVTLGEEIPVFAEFYTKSEMWPQESVDRYDKAIEQAISK